MHELFTALSFIAVIIAPTLLAAHASGVKLRHKRDRQKSAQKRSKGPITLFGNTTE